MLENMMTSMNSVQCKAKSFNEINHVPKGNVAKLTANQTSKQFFSIHRPCRHLRNMFMGLIQPISRSLGTRG